MHTENTKRFKDLARSWTVVPDRDRFFIRRPAQSVLRYAPVHTLRGAMADKSTQQRDREDYVAAGARLEQAKRNGPADRDFFEAAIVARRSIQESELLPYRNKQGEFEYELQQGLKAACHAREDVVAISVIQRALLKRLDVLKALLAVAIALLLYVAYRVS